MVRKRRFSQVTSSEDEDEPKRERRSRSKKTIRDEYEDDDPEEENIRSKKKKKKDDEEDEDEIEEDPDEEEEEEEEEPQAGPIGDPVRVSGKGKKRKKHYSSFEYDGNVFELEDPVLLTPACEDEKPYVAIIKDIADSGSGLMVTGQWFYRPEEAAKKGGGTWQPQDTRELFYSFHLDDVPAESVMHRCVVHFVPLNKKLPLRSQHPGFIVQKVYDTVERKLWKLTDKDYEDHKQDELNQLVKKTMDRLGELPDLETEDMPVERHDQPVSKWNLRRKNMSPIDTTRADGGCTKSDHPSKPETPASCPSDTSEFRAILAKLRALTDDSYRDKWLEKLLQKMQQACNPKEESPEKNGEKSSAVTSDHGADGNSSVDKKLDVSEKICWPDSAVAAVTALEKAAHETLGSDFQKYNQKMRKLDFNLKNNSVLARRLLNRELEPAVVINMSPDELKDGLTVDEKTVTEPDESEQLQMTDARCKRCAEKRVAITDIIHAGQGNRYQLECQACGHSWYGSGDAITSLAIDPPNAAAKFEDVEKKLVSPRDPEKPATDGFEKSTAVLEKQKSFNRSKSEEERSPTAAAANRE